VGSVAGRGETGCQGRVETLGEEAGLGLAQLGMRRGRGEKVAQGRMGRHRPQAAHTRWQPAEFPGSG